MGCACAKDREAEEGGTDRETLALCEAKLQRQTGKSVKTLTQSSDAFAAAIKRLSFPVSELYAIGDCISRSDSCTLSKAQYLCTDQACFLKIIPKNTRNFLQQKTKVVSDVEKLSLLDHPYILRVFEVIQDQDNFYVAIESFLGGQLIDHFTDARVCSEPALAKFMSQVFTTLHFCHQAGVVHGNLNFQTLVLSHQPDSNSACVKLTGFGDIDAIPSEGRNKVHESHFKPPEWAEGQSEKGDIWNCGVIMYILLSGEAPFGALSKPASTKKTVTFHSHKWSGKSAEVTSLLAEMLNTDPRSRLTAEQCRSHPWIKQHCKPIVAQPGQLKKHLFALKRSRARNNLQQAVLQYMITRVVKEKDVQSLVEPFFALDGDGDGVLTREELLRGYMLVLSEDDALYTSQKVFEAVDFNTNGIISFSEFLICALGERQLLCTENLQKVFRCIDHGGQNNVPLQDVVDFFFLKGTAEKERHWKELLTQVDRSGDAHIDFEEFSTLMTNINPT